MSQLVPRDFRKKERETNVVGVLRKRSPVNEIMVVQVACLRGDF